MAWGPFFHLPRNHETQGKAWKHSLIDLPVPRVETHLCGNNDPRRVSPILGVVSPKCTLRKQGCTCETVVLEGILQKCLPPSWRHFRTAIANEEGTQIEYLKFRLQIKSGGLNFIRSSRPADPVR